MSDPIVDPSLVYHVLELVEDRRFLATCIGSPGISVTTKTRAEIPVVIEAAKINMIDNFPNKIDPILLEDRDRELVKESDVIREGSIANLSREEVVQIEFESRPPR